MGTDNNIPLKGINYVFHSSLFEGTSPVLIEYTVNLLNEHKSLFLFGTNGNKDLNEYSKDNIYINTLINNLINKLSSISSLKVHSLFLNESLEQIFKNHPDFDLPSENNIDNETLYLFVIDNARAYFDSLSNKEIDSELALIKEINKRGIYTLFYFNTIGISNSYSNMALLLNKVGQFIPEASTEGIKVFLEEICSTYYLKLSSTCQELMLGEISKNNISLSIVAACIKQINLLLKDKTDTQRIVLSEHFDETGGFNNLIQKQYDLFKNKSYSLMKNQEGISLSSLNKEYQCFFQSFLIKNSENDFSFRNLTIENIKDISNLPLTQIKIIIHDLDSNSFKFLKKVDEYYTIISLDFLSHWEEMEQWKTEELSKINSYLDLNSQAILHLNGNADLLTGSFLDEAILWLNETNHNLHWARFYAPEYELTIHFIENSISNKKAALEASQRRSKRLLKISRGIAFVVGGAFILSSLAAILAGIERNNALLAKKNAESERKIAITAKEQAIDAKEFADLERKKALIATKAESIAKQLAENERLQAIVSRDEANQEKIKALKATKAEIIAKEQAELDRTIAISAKDVAEKERQNAIAARLEVDKALLQASNNFKRAEKLRKQQEARADALNSFRFILNNQIKEGLKLSASAYVVNSQNEGNPYEPEIYKSLVYGLNASIPNTFSLKLKQPLKNMAISGNGKLIAAFSIGGVITIFQPNFVKIIDIKIPFQKLESFCFTKNNDLLVGSTDGLIHLYDLSSGTLKWSRLISGEPIKSVLHLNEDNYIFSSFNDFFILNGLSQDSPFQKYKLPVEKPLTKIIKGNSSNFIYVTLGNSVYSMKINQLTSSSNWEKLLEIPNQISTLAIKAYQNEDYLLLGDIKGNIYLVNNLSGKIILNKKAHQSSITYCNLDIVKDDLLLISSGLDHKIIVDYIFRNKNEPFISKSTIDFDLHSAWVTDMVFDANTGVYYSCSDDMNIRKWFFDPNEIYNMAQIFLNEKGK